MKRGTRLNVFFLALPVLLALGMAMGQSASTVVYPQDNVSGGAVGARRPGLRVAAGIANHNTRMNVVTNPQGGVTVPVSTKTDRHTLVLTTFLQSFFDTMQKLADALLLAAQVSGSTTTGT